MRHLMARRVVRPVLVTLFLALCAMAELWATCGGGGGGGTGGMGMGSMPENVYQVPWKNISIDDKADPGGLVIYWFPKSQIELERSSLRNSRTLSLYAAQCVTMGVAPAATPLGEKLVGADPLPVAVLVDADGKVIGKAQSKEGMLKVDQVEKLLQGEVKARETAVKASLKQAKDDAKAGKKDEAITRLRAVVDQKCLFPGPAKDAAGELKKLGVVIDGKFPDVLPILEPALSARIEKTMKDGLMAEGHDKYVEAEKLYARAHQMDPADPAPLRYLGEVYRHHLGDWDKAAATFEQILTMPADPLSRAVALHGLGKMTIHNGEFARGLGLMEESARVFPLALTYRNLAVYWNSEGDAAKRDVYTRLAMAIDPDDPFNRVFAAAFAAGESPAATAAALKIAKEHDGLLCASYNLAAIYAQAGDKARALALLKRHFYEYERYPAVRSKEMMEARVDAVFASLYDDPTFTALTAEADGKLPIPRRKTGS